MPSGNLRTAEVWGKWCGKHLTRIYETTTLQSNLNLYSYKLLYIGTPRGARTRTRTPRGTPTRTRTSRQVRNEGFSIEDAIGDLIKKKCGQQTIFEGSFINRLKCQFYSINFLNDCQ